MPIENVENATRTAITVAGVSLSVPAPFVEGHVLRPNEAAALNQTYAENLRNNFASNVKKAIETAGDAKNLDLESLQNEMDEYITKYDFGVRRGGGGTRVVDPIEREALNLAKEKVKTALRNKGHNLKDIGAEQINKLAKQALEKYPQLLERAKQIVELKAQIGQETLDLGDVAPAKTEESEEGADPVK